MARWIRTLIIVGLSLTAVYAARMYWNRDRDMPAGPRTQVVVQWLIGTSTTAPADASGIGLADVFRIEDVLKASADGTFVVDGDDYGAGTANIFLYAVDPDMAVKRVVDLFEAGKLWPGMHIGIAQYKNAARTDWDYKPAYPPGLDRFDIAYKK